VRKPLFGAQTFRVPRIRDENLQQRRGAAVSRMQSVWALAKRLYRCVKSQTAPDDD